MTVLRVLGVLVLLALAEGGCATPFAGPLVDAHAHYDAAGQLRPRSGQHAGDLPLEMAQAHVERAVLLAVPPPAADLATSSPSPPFPPQTATRRCARWNGRPPWASPG
jgi:hypothetical protein